MGAVLKKPGVKYNHILIAVIPTVSHLVVDIL